MLNRSLLFLALTLQISLTSSNVNAANDLEKWNSEVGRTVRQTHSDKLAQTTYSEISSKNVTVSQDMKTVHPQIETSAQVAGSKTRVVAEAKLVVDKDKVWRDWNKKLSKFGKGTAAGVVGGAIVQGILDGVGWVMDPKNNTISKKDDSVNVSDKFQSTMDDDVLIYGDTEHKLCSAYAKWWKTQPDNIPKEYYPFIAYNAVFKKSGEILTCEYLYYQGVYRVYHSFKVAPNPNYQQEKPVTPVSDEEKEQVLKNLLNDPKYADLANKMIGNSYTIGSDNPEPDPNIVNDIKDAQKGTLKSDDPKGDGRTRTDPKIDTGTEVKGESKSETKSETQVDEKTVTNPDGSTTTTGTNVTNNTTITNNTFELPAFCDYAAKLCDWLDWTQEKPEEEESEEEDDINDRGIFDRDFDLDFSLGGQCPPNLSWSMNNKYLSKTFEIDLGWACMFFTAIGYALLFLSNCIGIWVMYETVVRKDLKW